MNLLTINEIETLINHSKDEQDQMVISLLYSSGLRVSEIINLRKHDLFLDENKGEVKRGKGGKQRYFYLNKTLS